ncbi:hypothetical protein ANCDUO_04785 [Ancylostoma duodenale]|uniref:Uncharacterized protein n=1 Tax=Ancylostoma duodenale TaxID=51022 RepID=A0A0C2D5R3_9BILA|nr:hypothetical protein ANCDUO_04785 [Ancylostoma duodenale]
MNVDSLRSKVLRMLKGKIYRTVVRPAMMYDNECCPVSKTHERMLNTPEMRMLRWVVDLRDVIRVPTANQPNAKDERLSAAITAWTSPQIFYGVNNVSNYDNSLYTFANNHMPNGQTVGRPSATTPYWLPIR